MSAINVIPTKKKILKPLLYAVIVLSVLLTAFRIYMITTDYETDSYFFKIGSVLPDIFNYILTGAVVLVFLFFIFSKGKVLSDNYGEINLPTTVFSAATGFLALVGGLYATSDLLIKEASSTTPEMMLGVTNQSTIMAQRLEMFAYIQCFLSLGVFAYFLLTAFSITKYSAAKSILGVIAILWHVVFLLVIYFDMSRPINAPIRIMFQFAVLVSMLYLIVEMRFIFRCPKPRFYLAISYVTILVLMSAAVPMAVCALTGEFVVAHTNFIYSIQFVAMLGYVISRVLTYLKQPMNEAKNETIINEEEK